MDVKLIFYGGKIENYCVGPAGCPVNHRYWGMVL